MASSGYVVAIPPTHSGCIAIETSNHARHAKAFEMLPLKDRNDVRPYHRSDVEVNKFSVEVQGTFSKFPNLCSRVSEPGPKKCLKCQWRLDRLNLVRDQHKEQQDQDNDFPGEEEDLIDFHDKASKRSRVVVEDMPAVFDMPKVRGLFDLAGEPPRRERHYKDKTCARLVGARPPIDPQRFMTTHSDVFADFQVRRLCNKLLEITHESGTSQASMARCNRQQFENCVAKGGLLSKLTQRRMSRAFDMLVEVERLEHVNRQCHLRRNKSRLHTVKLPTGKTLHVGEIRRSITQELDEPAHDVDEPDTLPTFHVMAWLRASEHAAVQVDCKIEAGDDVEWQLSIHDLLDTHWPWHPQSAGAEEQGAIDEVNHNFRGLFLGVTSRPAVICPTYVNTTLSGLRVRDGSVLHKGTMVAEHHSPINKLPAPAVVVLRLDRRKLSHFKKRGYACRLWVQRVSGCRENDEKARVLVDDLGIDDEEEVYPTVYASRPESDVRHAVKLCHFESESIILNSGRRPAEDLTHHRRRKPCQSTRSQGMREGDPTVSYSIDDFVERADVTSLGGEWVRFESTVPRGTEGQIVGFVQGAMEVKFPKYGTWTVTPLLMEKVDEVGKYMKALQTPDASPSKGGGSPSPKGRAPIGKARTDSSGQSSPKARTDS